MWMKCLCLILSVLWYSLVWSEAQFTNFWFWNFFLNFAIWLSSQTSSIQFNSFSYTICHRILNFPIQLLISAFFWTIRVFIHRKKYSSRTKIKFTWNFNTLSSIRFWYFLCLFQTTILFLSFSLSFRLEVNLHWIYFGFRFEREKRWQKTVLPCILGRLLKSLAAQCLHTEHSFKWFTRAFIYDCMRRCVRVCVCI